MSDAPAIAVLDTNAVLDWLVFADPAGLVLGAAIESARLSWVATGAMRTEFERVLPRLGPCRGTKPEAAIALWERWAQTTPEPPAGGGPACSDPDDQKFVDLAVHRGRSLLVSRDRAILRLCARLRVLGVEVLSPRQFAERAP